MVKEDDFGLRILKSIAWSMGHRVRSQPFDPFDRLRAGRLRAGRLRAGSRNPEFRFQCSDFSFCVFLS